MRQWVLALPIPLRLLLASRAELLAPVLQVVQRVLTGSLLERCGLKSQQADSGAVTLIQRFGRDRPPGLRRSEHAAAPSRIVAAS